MFTSEQVVKYLSKNPYKNVEFINCKIRIYMYLNAVIVLLDAGN